MVWSNGDSKPQLKQFLNEVQQGVVCKSIWTYDEVGHNQISRSEIVKLFGDFVFATPKPEKLLKRIIELSTNEGDFVLDFFGSGTTVAVAHKMRRKYVGIDQMDYIQEVAVNRLKKVIDGEEGGISKEVDWNGGGAFIFMEIKKTNATFLDSLNQCTSEEEVDELFQSILKSPFINYRFGNILPSELLIHFNSLSYDNKRKLVIDILDKNNLYLGYSEIEDKDYEVSENEIKLNNLFYSSKQ